LSLFGDINNLSEKPVSISMPTVTRTVAKGIPPRLRSPARPAKGKIKNKRKAVDSDTDEIDGEPEPRSKKRGTSGGGRSHLITTWRWWTPTLSQLLSILMMTKITAVPFRITAK
jgi:hypothetical protein